MLKKTVPEYKVDLLNITVRNVLKDEDTFLVYANEDVFGFVMLFNQKKDAVAEEEMKQFTQKLIGIVLSLKETYYLPYRLHATQSQFDQAYPQSAKFFTMKQKYDPNGLFSNQFYKTYHKHQADQH